MGTSSLFRLRLSQTGKKQKQKGKRKLWRNGRGGEIKIGSPRLSRSRREKKLKCWIMSKWGGRAKIKKTEKGKRSSHQKRCDTFSPSLSFVEREI